MILTIQEIDKLMHVLLPIVKDQGTLLLIVLRKKDLTNKYNLPVIGTNLPITTDALGQMNTKDQNPTTEQRGQKES